MIARLRGIVWESWPNRLILDCGGVGYEVNVPQMSVDQLNPVEGKEVSLLTYQHIREQAHTLYGFATKEEKDIFLLLVDRVSGIGPSIAMAILSGMPVGQFKDAVVNDDAVTLATIKGLGKKTAERIILELKDKVGITETWKPIDGEAGSSASSFAQEAELALLALGFKQADARKSITVALKENAAASVEDLIRAALRSKG